MGSISARAARNMHSHSCYWQSHSSLPDRARTRWRSGFRHRYGNSESRIRLRSPKATLHWGLWAADQGTDARAGALKKILFSAGNTCTGSRRRQPDLNALSKSPTPKASAKASTLSEAKQAQHKTKEVQEVEEGHEKQE